MAAQQDFLFDQGSDQKVNFAVKVLVNPDLPFDPTTNPYVAVDLTDSEIRMMWRTTYDSNIVVYTALSDTDPDIEGNNRFVITNAPAGLFKLVLSNQDTTDIRFTGDSVDYVYDIEIQDSAGEVTRAFEGLVTLSREVTR